MSLLMRKSVVIAAISLLIYYDIAYLQSAVIGFALLCFYLLLTGRNGKLIIRRLFGVGSRGWRGTLVGAFLSLYVLGLLAAAAVVFYKLTDPVIGFLFFLNGVLFLGGRLFAERASREDEGTVESAVVEESPSPAVKFFLYFIFAGAAFYFLGQNKSGAALLSPWQVIHPYYIYFFFISTALLGLLIFTRLKTTAVLFLLIIQTFLLHSYLPLTHELFYGADGWRHIAAEERILKGESILPNTFLGRPVNFLQSVDWGEFSYSQLRSLTVIFSRLLSIDLIKMNIWLLPILWSILCPLLLFELGRVLGWKKQESLFLAWLGLLPFAFQAGGSFTLPVNFGFLGFLLFAILIVGRMRSRRPEQVWILALLGIGSFFGYLLFFILFWLGWGMAEALYYIDSKRQGWSARTSSLFIILATALFIPALEFAAKHSLWNPVFNGWASFKQLVGNFSGFYLASGPRPHDILTGNIIFNQMPAYAFVPNLFTAWRWWIVLFLITFFILAAIGWTRLWKEENAGRWLSVFSAAIFGSYIISRYVLAGENILGRRLDIVLVLFFILFALCGLMSLRWWPSRPVLGIFVLVVCFSVAISASYSLGPDAPAVSIDEYDAMGYVWSKEWAESKHCVLADTNALLALEAVSAGKIVGGGFPMYLYFSQPERGEILSEVLSVPRADIWQRTLNLTGAKNCWLAVKGALPDGFGDVRTFGEIRVGRYK